MKSGFLHEGMKPTAFPEGPRMVLKELSRILLSVLRETRENEKDGQLYAPWDKMLGPDQRQVRGWSERGSK